MVIFLQYLRMQISFFCVFLSKFIMKQIFLMTHTKSEFPMNIEVQPDCTNQILIADEHVIPP